MTAQLVFFFKQKDKPRTMCDALEVNNMANEGNRPVKKFQAGGVSAAIWKNTMALTNGQSGSTLSVTVDRRYKDRDGVWKSSGSMRVNDLPKVILVLGKAYEYLTTGNENGDGVVEEEIVC